MPAHAETDLDGSLEVRSRTLTEAMRKQYRKLGITEPRTLDAIEMITDLTRLESRLLNDFDRVVSRELGISWAGYRILNSLLAFGELDQQALTRLSGTSRASTSSALTTLERDGMVTRRAPKHDRRRLMVDLTESGHRVLERAIKLQCERLLSWTAKLSGDELTQLRELMNHLVNQPHPD